MQEITRISTQRNSAPFLASEEPKLTSQDQRIVATADEQGLGFVEMYPSEPKRLEHRAVMWTCIASTPSSYGGALDTFELDKKYYSRLEDGSIQNTPEALSLFDSLFPAIEPLATDMPFLDYLYDFTILSQLGFKATVNDKGVFITVPDLELLSRAWEGLQQKNPNLPELELALRKDIASNKEFIRDWLGKKITVSEEIEYLHDLINHVAPRIILMNHPRYEQIQEGLAKRAREAQQTIVFGTLLLKRGSRAPISKEEFLAVEKHLPKIVFLLSALIDSLSAEADIMKLQKASATTSNPLTPSAITETWSNTRYKRCIEDQFPDEKEKKTTADELIQVVKTLTDLRTLWKEKRLNLDTFEIKEKH